MRKTLLTLALAAVTGPVFAKPVTESSLQHKRSVTPQVIQEVAK